MASLKEQLTVIVADTFASCGYDRKYGTVQTSDRPDLSQFQCNGALAAARQYSTNPRQIAQAVVDKLSALDLFQGVTIAGAGFINLTLRDEYLVQHIRTLAADERHNCTPVAQPRKVIVDYGGANIAKPMHVGHMRAAIIGESLKRLTRFLGHAVLGDVHLGDWGLPMGMVISELKLRHPDWPYFDPNHQGPYPAASPVTIADLEELYPAASQRTREDPAALEAARQATFALQNGQPGYFALWRHFMDVSLVELKRDYADLNVEFDLWLGESDTRDRIMPLIERLQREGYAHESQGALIVDVTQPEDAKEMPPLLLIKTDGAVLYGTTDLATIEQRVQELSAELILYVVDKRQSNHFQQVFRAAHKTGVAPATIGLEHIAFGTMNGKDGKPFKTRTGGVMRLRSLIDMVIEKAQERLTEVEAAKNYDAAEKAEIAHLVGMATLKYADLMNHRAIDYVFDLDRFSAFEGRTGPYLLYTMARSKSILRKASELGYLFGPINAPADEGARALLLKLAELPDVLDLAFAERAPNHLCEYAYTLATTFNRFYHDHHILSEPDQVQQASWLALAKATVSELELVLNLLGIQTPERM
ncbi:MAG: arginine--tRNA ligase [Chloroflexi bacterium]|nr:arginine--tRNA ligase [Chloroflexota bacterium]